MKIRKTISRLIVGLLATVMIFGTALLTLADTSASVPTISATKEGNQLIISIVAKDNTELGGIRGTLKYDNTVFSYAKIDSVDELYVGLIDYDPDSDSDIITFDVNTKNKIIINSGDPIVQLYFDIEDIESDKEYLFQFTFMQAYDSSIDNDYEWNNDSISVNYTDTEEEPTPYPETESSADAETESSGDTETESSADAETESSGDTETESSADAETESSADAETESSSDSETDKSTAPEKETTTEGEDESTTKAEEETTTDPETESSSDAEIESSSDQETEGTTGAEETTTKVAPANDGESNNNGGSQSDSSVKTADTTNLIVLVVVMGICGMVIASVLIIGKRKNFKNYK